MAGSIILHGSAQTGLSEPFTAFVCGNEKSDVGTGMGRLKRHVGLVVVAVAIAAAGVAVSDQVGAQAPLSTKSVAEHCFDHHKFGSQPVDVTKTLDGEIVLARTRWGWSHSIGCYLSLDEASLAVLRDAGQPSWLPTGPTRDSERCFDHHGFGREPVDVAKTADGEIVLARLVWVWSSRIGCYLTLDWQAAHQLRDAYREIRGWAAMGDSFSSGQGDDDASGDCQRSDNAAAKSASRRLQQPTGSSHLGGWEVTGLELVACSGNRPQDFDQQWSQYVNGGRDEAEIISFSFGGNDIGFSGVIDECAGLVSNCETYCENRRDECGDRGVEALLKSKIDDLAPRWEELYVKAANKLAARGEVYVVGYPALIAEDTDWLCRTVHLGAGDDEIAMLRRVAVHLDEAIRGAVGGANKSLASIPDPRNPGRTYGERINYVPVIDWFDGHEVCGKVEPPWINGRREGWFNTAQKFHPTAEGHRQLGHLLAQRVAETWPHDPETAPTLAQAIPKPDRDGEISDYLPELKGSGLGWHEGDPRHGDGFEGFWYTFVPPEEEWATNWAVWTFDDDPPWGDYIVEVYVPSSHATASVAYDIRVGGNLVASPVLDQFETDDWKDIGTIWVQGQVTITVEDGRARPYRAGDGLTYRFIGIDGARLVPARNR